MAATRLNMTLTSAKVCVRSRDAAQAGGR